MRSLVERQFGAHAGAYATSEVHAKGESLARLADLVPSAFHWQALDVATGAGHTALLFAPKVARVIASDMTSEMLAEVEKLAAARGLANVETAVAAADALPFPDGTFDLVTCRLAAHHFPEPRRFFDEARRVLKPGGWLGFVDNIAPDATFPAGLNADEIAATDRLYDAFERLRDPSHGRTLALDEVVAMAGTSGLEVTRTERLSKPMAFQAWAERQGCSPATIDRLRSDLGNPTLARFLTPAARDGDLWFTLQECVVIGRRQV